tara:strand:- start:717 stop:911 length:195 start_codon:yes stop_codon:yes gene_type:complete
MEACWMSNTTWKRSGSIHQVRLFPIGSDGPYLFGTKEEEEYTNMAFHFFYRLGCWRRPPKTRKN